MRPEDIEMLGGVCELAEATLQAMANRDSVHVRSEGQAALHVRGTAIIQSTAT